MLVKLKKKHNLIRKKKVSNLNLAGYEYFLLTVSIYLTKYLFVVFWYFWASTKKQRRTESFVIQEQNINQENMS